MNGFDLSPVCERTAISNMDTILGDINILDKKGQRFSNSQSRFIEQPDEQTIALVRTSVEQQLHLISCNDLWMVPLLFLLFQNMLGNWRTLGQMMKERFVTTSTSWQVGWGFVFHFEGVCFHSPMVVVEAGKHAKRVVDRPM